MTIGKILLQTRIKNEKKDKVRTCKGNIALYLKNFTHIFPSYKHYMCNVHVGITQGTLISLYFTRIITFKGGL